MSAVDENGAANDYEAARRVMAEQRATIEELAKEINRWELAAGFPEATPEALSERLTALAEAVAQAESERDALRAELKWVRQNAKSAVEKLNLALGTAATEDGT
jgi:chromosome segregation ATPase